MKVFLILAPIYVVLLIASKAFKALASYIVSFVLLFKFSRDIRKLALAVAIISFIIVSLYRNFYTPFLSKEKTVRYLTGDEPSYLFITKSKHSKRKLRI